MLILGSMFALSAGQAHYFVVSCYGSMIDLMKTPNKHNLDQPLQLQGRTTQPRRLIRMVRRVIGVLVTPAALLVMVTSCSNSVEQGQSGLAIKNPLIFGSPGLEVLPPGRHYLAPTSSFKVYDMRPFKVSESFDDMITKDNVPVDFSIHLTLKLNPAGVATLFKEFGDEWYNANIKESFRTDVRNACKEFSMQDLTTDAKVSEYMTSLLQASLSKMLITKKIPIFLEGIEIGKVNPPNQVIEEIANTAVAQQARATEIQKLEREKAREQTEKQRATSDKAYMQSLAITPEQYIQLREIEIRKEMIEVIKSKPNVSIIANLGGDRVSPMVQVK